MSNAAQAYARTSQTTASPREIEAQALLKAARQLQEVQTNWAGPGQAMENALLFNRRLWSIFMSAAQAERKSAADRSSPEHRQYRRVRDEADGRHAVESGSGEVEVADRHQLQPRCRPVGPRLTAWTSGSQAMADMMSIIAANYKTVGTDRPVQDALCGGRSDTLRRQLDRKIRRQQDVQDHGLERHRLSRQGAIPERAAPANFRKC